MLSEKKQWRCKILHEKNGGYGRTMLVEEKVRRRDDLSSIHTNTFLERSKKF